MSNKVNVKSLLIGSANPFDTIAACKEFAACKFGYGFIARSTPKFQAPKRTAAEWLSVFGCEMPNIVKVTKVTNARSGSYENKVNKALAKSDVETPFESGGLNGYEWVVPNIIKRAIKDSSLQLCVTFTKNDKTKFESFYIVGDHFANDEELYFIKSHLYVAPNKSVKQTESGVSEDEIVMVRNYKFDNVVRVGKTTEVEDYWNAIG